MQKPVSKLIVAMLLGMYVFSLALPGVVSAGTGISVKLIVNPSITDIDLDAGQVALTARTQGKNLSFEWTLTGPGKIEGSGSSVFYVLPPSIEGDTAKALVSVTVKEEGGQEVTETVAFNIRGEGAPSSGMSTGTKVGIGVGAAVLIGVAAVAGGGGSDGGGSNAAGTWNVSLWSPNDWTANINQSGSSLSGTARQNSSGWELNISGTASGSNISMRWTDGSYWNDLTGIVSGNSMNGTATDSDGDTDAWSATR